MFSVGSRGFQVAALADISLVCCCRTRSIACNLNFQPCLLSPFLSKLNSSVSSLFCLLFSWLPEAGYWCQGKYKVLLFFTYTAKSNFPQTFVAVRLGGVLRGWRQEDQESSQVGSRLTWATENPAEHTPPHKHSR